MSIVQFTRFKADDSEQVIKNAKLAKQIVEGPVDGRMAGYYAMR